MNMLSGERIQAPVACHVLGVCNSVRRACPAGCLHRSRFLFISLGTGLRAGRPRVYVLINSQKSSDEFRTRSARGAGLGSGCTLGTPRVRHLAPISVEDVAANGCIYK